MAKKYIIFKDDIEINRIVSDEEFIIVYCNKQGYTYEEYSIETPEKPETETEPTIDEVLNVLLGVDE